MNVDNRQEAELFDVDGTLCNVSGIRHYVTGENRDFHRFHMASQFCPANLDVVAKAQAAKVEGRAVLVVTSRMARYRQLTRRWLDAWDVPFDRLRTRADGDFRKDVLVKLDILDELERDFIIVKAHDDNPEVITGWRGRNIPVDVVPGWDEQFQ